MEFDELPFEVLLHVVSYLRWRDVQQLRQCSRVLRDVCGCNSAWRGLVSQHFPLEEESGTNNSDEWRAQWIELCNRNSLLMGKKLHVFMVLDNLPIVRRTMGVSQVFVLHVDAREFQTRHQNQPVDDGAQPPNDEQRDIEQAKDGHELPPAADEREDAGSSQKRLPQRVIDFLYDHEACVAKRCAGEAPWGNFECIMVNWGTLFAGFSFYRGSAISSIYLGCIRGDSVLGSMHSAWNDVTGSFFLQEEKPFLQNVRENEWGDAFCDFHVQRSEQDFKEKRYALCGPWTVRAQLFDRTQEMRHPIQLELHVDSQVNATFLGWATGFWRGNEDDERAWRMRGTQHGASGEVALLLEDDADEDGPSATIMLVGKILRIGGQLVMKGVVVVDEGALEALVTGTFECTANPFVQNPMRDNPIHVKHNFNNNNNNFNRIDE